VPQQRQVAQPDATTLEELELQPEAQAQQASPPPGQPLQAVQPGAALPELEAQPEVASVSPREAQPRASLPQEALRAEPAAPRLLPSFE
jgi:hypothetical protein